MVLAAPCIKLDSYLNCQFQLIVVSFSGLASPAQLDLNGTEVVLSEGKSKPEIISEQLVNFFNPVSKCHCDRCGAIFIFFNC